MYKLLATFSALVLCISCSNVSEQPTEADSASGSMMETLSLKKEQNTNVKLLLEQKSIYILSLLQRNDFSSLASEVHPELGLLLSSNPSINIKDSTAQILDRKELAGFLKNTTPRVWGMAGYTNTPLQMTGKDFWETQLYTRVITPEFSKSFDTVQVTGMNEGAVKQLIEERFPGSHFVEYKVPSVDPMEDKSWSLRLIFNEYKGQWYLVGIVRDQFKI